MFRHHFATFRNMIEMCKIDTFERNLSTMFLKILNIYLVLKIIFQLQCNIRNISDMFL